MNEPIATCGGYKYETGFYEKLMAIAAIAREDQGFYDLLTVASSAGELAETCRQQGSHELRGITPSLSAVWSLDKNISSSPNIHNFFILKEYN